MIDSLRNIIKEKYEGCDQCYIKWFDLVESIDEGVPGEGVQFLWEILKEAGVEADDLIATSENLKCPNCQENLSIDSLLVADIGELQECIVELVADNLNQEISECTYCNTDIIPFTQKYDDPVSLLMGIDLMNYYQIPNELSSEIASRLQCNCGTPLNSDDPYVTRSQLDRWHGEEDEVVEAIIKTFGILEKDVYDFTEFIYSHPMLGLHHETGQLIFNKLKERNISGIAKLRQGEIFYRARKRNSILRMVPFIDDELWAPPLGISGHGRFNPVGVQVLYLADSRETGLFEIDLANSVEDIAEIGEFLLLKDLEVWDVRGTDISRYLSMPTLNKRNISREYLLPNFIAQCCTLAKINAIIYDSVKNPSGYNIATLNYVKGYDITIYSVSKNIKP